MIQLRTRKFQNSLLLASVFLVLGLATPKAEALQSQPQDGLSQDRIVSGVIISETDNQPIPGVSVLIKGTTNGPVTNIDGEYSLSVNTQQGDFVFEPF